jgi:hypothetical protein
MKLHFFLVIPAQAGIQYQIDIIVFFLDPGLRRGDEVYCQFLWHGTSKFYYRSNRRHDGGAAGSRLAFRFAPLAG